MLKSIVRKGMVCQIVAFAFSCSLLALPCQGAVIFETTFDSNADWNASKQYEGNECIDPCTTAPTNWTNYRVVDGSGSWTNPTGSIRKLPGSVADHSGTGTGKGYVVYNESHPVDNWPGDSELVKNLHTEYPEIYFRAWMRTQPGWQSVTGASSKIFRIEHFDQTGNIFANFSTGDMSPIALLLFGQMGGSTQGAYVPAFRCAPQSSNYYCTSAPSYMQNDIFTTLGTAKTVTTSWADGNWHQYDIHVKMNTIGSNNGVFEFSVDGTLMVSRTDAQWKVSGAGAGDGWNTISIGGNSNNSFATQAEQWYAIDDVVVSTTPIPAGYTIGGGTTPASPSAPPNATGSGHQ